MTDRELMQQALEALETKGEHHPRVYAAITALRERLAQPEQEPIAWVYPEALEALKSGRPWTAYGSNGDRRIPLYLNDAVARRVEPRSGESGAGFESLPASPTWWDEPVAQMNYRKWQGLTDEEIKIIWRDIDGSEGMLMRFARAIEAKLKEKNT